MTRTIDKAAFVIKLTYFKESGKFYTNAQFEGIFERIGDHGQPIIGPYMNDVVEQVRGYIKDKTLPGLQSGSWDGPILVDCDLGYPCLILPRKGK